MMIKIMVTTLKNSVSICKRALSNSIIWLIVDVAAFMQVNKKQYFWSNLQLEILYMHKGTHVEIHTHTYIHGHICTHKHTRICTQTGIQKSANAHSYA